MRVTLGIERWTIQPETTEEMIIFLDYLERLPKVTTTWDTARDIIHRDMMIQTDVKKIAGVYESPYLILDFDPDANLEET